MIRRLTTFLAALLLVAGATGSVDALRAETIKKIKEAGVLRVGVAEARPMNVRDPATGQWSGFNIEMARDLAKVLGVKLELMNSSYATLIPGLMTGKYEIIMAQLFANPERSQVVAFTDFYSTAGLKVVVRQDSSFKAWEELNDKKVVFSVNSGTQDEAVARKLFPDATFKATVGENTYAFFLELAADRADAGITDTGSIKIYLQQNPQMKLRVLEPERVANLTGRGYAVRPDDWHFLNFLNVWLSQTKGTYEHLLK
jgi:ABC-type amino acid transport substrate-binding protein